MRAQIFSIIRQTFAVTIGKIYLGASPNNFPINSNQKYLWNYCTDVKYESIADRNDVTCALFVVVYHISEVAYLQILNKRNVYSQVFKNVEIKATCHSNQIITGNTCYSCKTAEVNDILSMVTARLQYCQVNSISVVRCAASFAVHKEQNQKIKHILNQTNWFQNNW